MATISLIHEYARKYPLDEVVFSEVMYCRTRGISAENPIHLDFMYNTVKPTIEAWGYKFTVVRSEETDFLKSFYHTIERPRLHPEHKGMTYGFPSFSGCPIRRDCKIKPMDQHFRSISAQGMEIVRYEGIAYDEPKRRLDSLHKSGAISVLEQEHVTEAEARQICRENGLLSPVYSGKYAVQRTGCWFCPCSKQAEAAAMKKHHPDIWAEYVALEETPNLCYKRWNCYSDKTLKQRDKELDKYSQQLSFFD